MKKLIWFLWLFPSLLFAQNNMQGKAMYSWDNSIVADTTTIKNTLTSYQSSYGHAGGLYFNKFSNKWRVWNGICPDTSQHNGCWIDLPMSKGGTNLVTSVFTRTGAITAQLGDYASFYWKLSGTSNVTMSTIVGNPTFSGNPLINQTQFTNPGTKNMFWGETPNTSITSGSNNIGIGELSFANLTSGSANTGLGEGAGRFNVLASNNTAIGANALHDVDNNGSNTAVGSNALRACSAQANVGIGYGAMQNSQGNHNVGVGYNAGNLITSTTSGTNTAIGGFALSSLSGTFSDKNVAVGYNALGNQTVNDQNTAIGTEAGLNVSTGRVNTFLGSGAGNNITTGQQNISIGYASQLPSATSNGQLNIQNAIYGTGNTAINAAISTGNIGLFTQSPTARIHLPAGTSTANTAPLKITPGTNLASPESGAIESNGTHLYWTSSTPTRFQLDQQGGAPAGSNTQVQFNNSGSFGASSNFTWDNINNALTVGQAKIFTTNSAGNTNTWIGNASGNFTNSGTTNTAVGTGTMTVITSGSDNTSVGAGSLSAVTTGGTNVAIGSGALDGVTTGSDNTVVGAGALQNITTATTNTVVGRLAGSNLTSGNTNIFIGYNVQAPSATGSNQVVIGSLLIRDNNGEVFFTITRTTCSGAPSGALAVVAGVLTQCP